MQTLDLVRLLGAGLSFLFAVVRFGELVWDVLSDQRKAEMLKRLSTGLGRIARGLDGLQLALIILAARLWQRAERLMGRDLDIADIVDKWQSRPGPSVTPPPADEAPPSRPPSSRRRKGPQ